VVGSATPNTKVKNGSKQEYSNYFVSVSFLMKNGKFLIFWKGKKIK